MSTEPEQSKDLVPAPRNQSETLEWLSRQTGTEVKTVDGKLVISFGKEIGERLNCLCAVSQVAQIDPNFSPAPRIAPLNIESDAFEPNKGKFSLNKVGMMKLADLAQIQVVGQQMRYLGLQGIEAIVTVRMRAPDGTWTYDKQSKAVRFDQLKRTVERRLKKTAKKYKKAAPTQDDIDQAYDEELEFVNEKASTKAFLRCVKKLLSIQGNYSRADLQKPFLVITWNFTPDWSQPQVAEKMMSLYRESSAELYGGSEQPALEAAPPEPARDIDVLPAAGGHAAAAIAAAEREAEALEAAEDEAEAEAAARESLPGEEAATPAPAGVEEDPEAWDMDEDESLGGVADIPKPEAHFCPTKGPFAKKDVEEIVASEEGKVWLAKMVKGLKSDEKRAQALAWLEWGTSGDVTAETLDEFLASADA